MSKTELLEVIADLPERCLERAITDCLVSLIANSEYFIADQIISNLLIKVKLRPNLRLRARVFGVQIACRNRNLELALSRYQDLIKFPEVEVAANARSSALFQLAGVLLPGRTTQLFALWKESLSENLPFHARHDLAAVGMMLARCYLKSGAKNQAFTICQTIASTLNPVGYGKKLERLMRAICQTDE